MKNNLKSLTLTAMFLAIGLVLPFLTGQIPQIGNMLLPMLIPVFFVRAHLRLGVRHADGVHSPAYALCDIHHASLLSVGCRHGV